MKLIEQNSITIVIVVYNTNLVNCLTYKMLIKNIANTNFNYDLIIFNNSKDIKIPPNNSYVVVNSIINNKLNGAYNFALNYAVKNNRKWLLLLDQDSEITSDYFNKLDSFLNSNFSLKNIVAIVPFLTENSKTLSPHKIKFFNCKRLKIHNSGFQKGYVTAFNSLSLLSVEFMSSIGGFSVKFPLDMLDYWYYFQIYKLKKNVFVLDTFINHQLSITSYERNISIERHLDLLLAENTFIKELSIIHYFFYKGRLTFRLFKQFLFFKDKRYAVIIFKILFNKI